MRNKEFVIINFLSHDTKSPRVEYVSETNNWKQNSGHTNLRHFTSLLCFSNQLHFRIQFQIQTDFSAHIIEKWNSLQLPPTPTLSASSAPEKWPSPSPEAPSAPATCRRLAFAPPFTPIPRAAPPSNPSASPSSLQTTTYCYSLSFFFKIFSLKKKKNKRHAVLTSYFPRAAGRSRKQRRRFVGETSIRYCYRGFDVIALYRSPCVCVRVAFLFTCCVVIVVVAVKDVVLKLRPLLTKNKLLVSVAAGIKLKDLQVTECTIFFLSFCFVYLCCWI